MTYKPIGPLVAYSTALLLCLASCKTSEESSSLRQHKALEDATAPKEAALADFAWEPTDLPACIGSRAGSNVFVWREQKTVRCDGGAWK
jgi:hypothetical protein